jgi:transposase
MPTVDRNEDRLALRRRFGLVASISASDGVCTGVSDGAMARVEVITGPERRRRWTEEQKRAIVAASLEPGAVVADVARRAEIGADQIYRWRQQFTRGDSFAQVLIAPPEATSLNAARNATCAEPVVEVEFMGKARVRIPGSIRAELGAAIIKALARR